MAGDTSGLQVLPTTTVTGSRAGHCVTCYERPGAARSRSSILWWLRPYLRRMRIEPFGRRLGRIAVPREPGVETVEAGREGVSHDFAGDFSGSEVECVGERPVQVLCEVKRRGQPLDEKVLSLGRDDAVRVDAGPDSLRGFIKRNSIALLSGYVETPVDPPSLDWLGRYSTRERVRRSGLWNNNHVDECTTYSFWKCCAISFAKGQPWQGNKGFACHLALTAIFCGSPQRLVSGLLRACPENGRFSGGRGSGGITGHFLEWGCLLFGRIGNDRRGFEASQDRMSVCLNRASPAAPQCLQEDLGRVA